MNFKAKCTEVKDREDHYDIVFSTYKQTLKGRFERSELRHLIEIIDNSINVGLDGD